MVGGLFSVGRVFSCGWWVLVVGSVSFVFFSVFAFFIIRCLVLFFLVCFVFLGRVIGWVVFRGFTLLSFFVFGIIR